MEDFEFFTGMHHPHNAHKVPAACVSYNAVRNRKSAFQAPVKGYLLDSGAFTIINTHGRYPEEPCDYALGARRIEVISPGLRAVVSQDYMCEPFVLAKTGLTIEDHQRLTIERHDELVAWWSAVGGCAPIMPVLQGFTPQEYVNHIRQYGSRLTCGMWVGVGSVCKRQGDPSSLIAVLEAIASERPDLRLHGFGVKLTALRHPRVRELLATADSMAWSYSARKQGRDANSPVEALAFHHKVVGLNA